MRTILITIAAILLLSIAISAQNQSVYTSTKTTNCRTIKSSSKEAGSYLGECPGVGGYKIHLIEGDLRQTIDIITPAKKKFELNFWHFYSAFSSIGEKVEWRTKAGVPVALIARYEVADPEGVKKSTSYLLISKISKTESCVTDVVPPGAKQNEDARKLADAAISKPCKSKE
ncbi:MAG: hypothetical protein ABL999_13195 [Pyrinomonadaceae bacterium]